MKTLASALRFLFVLLTATALSHSVSAEAVFRSLLNFAASEHTGRLNIEGNYLYLTLNSAELRILDIADRTQPTLVGRVQTRLGNQATAFYGTDVEVAGDFAYVCCGLNVVVVNIANKANPTVVARVPRPTQAISLDLVGETLYVGDAASLAIYSLANPASPQLLGTYAANAEVREVVVANQLAYLAAHLGGFMIVDVAIPSSPTRVGLVPRGPSASPIDLALDGNRAYVATDYLLKIYDVSNPAAPALLGESSLGVGFQTGQFRDAVTCANGFVYVHGFGRSFQVVDVRDPIRPRLVSSSELPGNVGNTGADILADGSTLFIANGSAGVRIFDLATPDAPQPVSNYNITTSIQSVFLAPNRAYAANAVGEIIAINTTDIANPQVIVRVQTLYPPRFLVSAGNRFFSVFNGGFELYSLENPNLPSLLGRFSGPVTSVAGSGNYAFVSRPGSIDTLDLSNPSAIATVATHPVTGDMTLELGAPYLAASAPTGSTYLFDITNPLALREIGTYPEPALSMDFDANTLFISNANGARALIVTQNAVTPADSIAVQGAVAADASRLWVNFNLIDARDLSNLTATGPITAGQPPNDLAATGPFMAVATGSALFFYEGILPDLAPRPELQAIYNGSQLTIRWPATFPDYKLYVASSIGAQWELVSDTLPQENGYYIYLNRFPTAPMRLYQLIKQP